MSNFSSNQGNISTGTNPQLTPQVPQVPQIPQAQQVLPQISLSQQPNLDISAPLSHGGNCNIPCSDVLMQQPNMLGPQIMENGSITTRPFSDIMEKFGKFVFFGHEIPSAYVIGFLVLGLALAAYYIYIKYYKNENDQQKQLKEEQNSQSMGEEQYPHQMYGPSYPYDEPPMIPPYPKNENQFPLMGTPINGTFNNQQKVQERPKMMKPQNEETKNN